MARIVTGQTLEASKPPLTMRVAVTVVVEEAVFPSMLIDTEDETMTAEAVLSSLDEEYTLSKGHGLLNFLYDQSWIDSAAVSGSINIQ